MKRKLKRLFFQSLITEANGDSSKLWKAIKRLLKNAENRYQINSIDDDTDPLQIVNNLNEFFVNVGPNLANAIGTSGIDLNLNEPNIAFLELEQTNEEEVMKLLMSIGDGKATGEDGIPVRFLKSCNNTVVPLITHIINCTITQSKIPNEWKQAVVIPLFKDGDKNCSSNYRPISILPAISKILEKVVHNQVYTHLSTYNLLSEAQFGFRKNHSTATCILRLLDTIYTGMENGMMTGVIFLDLKKAFDTVNHCILLNKLRTFGISQKTIDWFRSYLTGRFQAVKHRGVTSEYLEITCGVPQGSILGPLLFIMYINDMVEYVQDCKLSLYADDTAMYTCCKSNIELMMTLNIELGLINEWLKANKLTINVTKTKYVVFGTRHMLQTKPDLNLKIGGKPIERVSTMKYLGVLLDDLLTFEEHITHVVTKSTQKLGILRKSREFLDRKTSTLLYKSLVLPHIDYCDIVYMTTTEYNLHRLQLIQNVVCRIILRADNRTSVTEMHKELSLLTIKERQSLHMSMECFRQVNTQSSLNHMFTRVNSRVTRGSTNVNMTVPNLMTNSGRKSFSFRGPNHWNSLPNEVKAINTKQTFKSSVSKLFSRDVNHPG